MGGMFALFWGTTGWLPCQEKEHEIAGLKKKMHIIVYRSDIIRVKLITTNMTTI
jgi:hypothetical protein